MTPRELLHDWLAREADAAARQWFEDTAGRIANGSDKDLYVALGLVPRKLGKADLVRGDDDLAAAEKARPGWDPRGWSVDQAARVALLLAAAERDPERFPELLETLCNTADVGEQVAFYKGLPLYPHPERLVARASEGARSNMKALFEAVAHRNPFPAENFSELAWNHMVLKALFVGSTLWPIQGLDRRANAELTRMLCDFADERWAAGRDVSPELWRCVVADPSERTLKSLDRALEKGDAGGAEGAALALAAIRSEAARAILEQRAPGLARAIERGELSWDSLASEAA